MYTPTIILIAFEEIEHLGMGYLSSILCESNYQVKIIDFRRDKTDILTEVLQCDPLLIGFSVIYDDHIYNFKSLVEYLRNNGILCHFTAGGHFASLRPANLFKIIPFLDSIVRFEGEHTLLDLVQHLHNGKDWKEVTGLSYKKDGTVVNNKLRPLKTDLDAFPFPLRPELKEYALKKKYTILLAGRGCVHNCTFCDIKEFYRQPPGPIKRIRNPEKVVEEIKFIYEEKDCLVFLFQDDDFPVVTKKSTEWIERFCMAIRDNDLTGKIMWKINCRPDEINLESFEMMKEHGLFRVFMGIEDGTDYGLRKMNKKLNVSDNLSAINILKKLEINIDYGFMLFQPDTTFNSLRENLNFLRLICEDGYMPVTFLKMMPYLETEVEKELRKAGRIKGIPGSLDYDFLVKSMDDYYDFVSGAFNTWLNSPQGLSNISKWADIYNSVFSFYYGDIDGPQYLINELRTQVSDANKYMLDTLHVLSEIFESNSYDLENDEELEYLRSTIDEKHDSTLKQIKRIILKFEMYYLLKDILGFEARTKQGQPIN